MTKLGVFEFNQTSFVAPSGRSYIVRTKLRPGGDWRRVSEILRPSALRKRTQRLAQTAVIAERVRKSRSDLRRVVHLIDPDAHVGKRMNEVTSAGLDLQRIW